ncbi:hypothetical protein TorRG33x02_151390 [Trema orientale]|uniref:Uncharacterized protein n=1 Tax=Trema orientale TaxID=63057 RepID=A0A2P5EU56_TREOI|nr:hypothetical protein TorRG33x02_151390 [Trema orientale]
MASISSSFTEISANAALPSSDELEHVPLIRRRTMLLANKRADCNSENGTGTPLMSSTLVKEENEGSDAPDVFPFTSALSPRQVVLGVFAQAQNHAYKGCEQVNPKVSCNRIVEDSVGDHCLQNGSFTQDVGSSRDCLTDCSEKIECTESNGNVAQVGKLDSNISALPESSTLSEVPAVVHVGNTANLLHSMEGDNIKTSYGADIPTIKVENEVSNHIANDHLDHIVLKERQRMLLSSKLLGFAKPVLEVSSGASSGQIRQFAENLKEETHDVTGESLAAKSQFDDTPERNASDLYDDRICSLTRKSIELNSCEGHGNVPVYTNDISSSFLSTSVKIKGEPQNENNFQSLDDNARDTVSVKMCAVKTEMEISNELDGDEAEHMCLGDRAKLIRSRDDSELNMSSNYGWLKKSVPYATGCSPVAAESAKAFSINRPRKRRKTATDSVEAALEEDAPGLLQVLAEKGVTADEIKLYGEMESDEALDESSGESFSELESVISKIFIQRHSFLKFAPIRFTKGARASYCLACLLSLVEQTRYLQFRKWPVEWGWCRDLQSFIFVFERHNRIVLERPEYGYATYFFELVESLPIDWQIKRLVTAMKLTTCSRISLIENKALSVGQDLTEGEAKVLTEYGWVPNSGLGTMLKYCDRVVHDRKSEKDTSEWRTKIGNLLMDGYNGGTLVATDIPKKVMEYRDSQSSQVKLEPILF